MAMKTAPAVSGRLSAHEGEDAHVEDLARVRARTPAECLELGVALSRTAAELRRAAWEAQRAGPSTSD